MDADSWVVLNRLLDEALELPPADRPQWIARLAPEYDAVRPQLRRLLDGADSATAGAFLDTIPKLQTTETTNPDNGDAEPVPASVGPYTILGKLAEGGMGDVWLGERTDGLLKRQVAIKLPRGVWPRTGLAERMARERDILATLNHPNIARLYDAGLTSTGQPYLALEFVPGQPIDQYANAERLSVRARLRLFLQVARAVAHAHARLVVHRDLKPANVLVTAGGEVKLLDFGIAKLLESDSSNTAITEASGLPLTPDYASPEQIAGEPLGVASDVYSLGVLLYELLTGSRPYTLRRGSRRALEDAILQAVPRRPSDAVSEPTLRRALRGDLDTIVQKAIRKTPGERYDTINALADDIERYLHGHAVLARPDRVWYRLSKFVARNAIAVGAATTVLIVTLTGAGLVTWQARAAFTQKARAEEVSEFLTTIFREASPYNGAGRALSVSDWLKHVKDRVDRRFNDSPALRVELLNSVGSSLLTLQDTAAAEIVLTQAAQDGGRHLGADHPETLRAHVLLTGVQRFQGRTREMRIELDRLMPLLGARPALAEHLIIATRNRAHLEVDEGHYREAERIAQEAVDLGTARFGDRHPETVAAYLVLAWTYHFSRSAEEALEASERGYRMAAALYPDAPQQPRVIEGRLLYGRALGEAGRLGAGIDQLKVAVDDAASVFGASSRMVGLFSVPLATFQLAAGEITESLETSRRAFAIVSEHTSAVSFRYAAALQSRGAALLGARRAAEALPDLTRAVETLRRVLGPAHSVTRAFAVDQALALAQSGRFDEAEQLLLEMLMRDPPPSDRQTARLRHVLGVTKRLRGEYRAALDLQQQSLASLGDGAETALERMKVLTEIGLNLQDQGTPAGTRAILEQALSLSQQLQRRMNPDRADVFVGLGRARLAAGQSTEALPLLQEAARFWRGFDSQNRWAGETAFWLGRTQVSLRRGAQARSSLAHAAHVLSRSPIQTDIELARLARTSKPLRQRPGRRLTSG